MIEPALLGAGASAVGIFHFFAGLLLILTIYTTFLGFTYWISRGE